MNIHIQYNTEHTYALLRIVSCMTYSIMTSDVNYERSGIFWYLKKNLKMYCICLMREI